MAEHHWDSYTGSASIRPQATYPHSTIILRSLLAGHVCCLAPPPQLLNPWWVHECTGRPWGYCVATSCSMRRSVSVSWWLWTAALLRLQAATAESHPDALRSLGGSGSGALPGTPSLVPGKGQDKTRRLQIDVRCQIAVWIGNYEGLHAGGCA